MTSTSDLPLVISLCDYSGNIVYPWARSGLYECWTIDIRHKTGISDINANIRQVGCDIRRFELPKDRSIVFICAFPPCTHLAVSGARHFKNKGLECLLFALSLVVACKRLCESLSCPYLIENPISTLSTYWRKPDYTFDPCDYGGYSPYPGKDAYTKKTCLWTGNGFKMPKRKRINPIHGSLFNKISDKHIRSITPLGFSNAVYEANKIL